MLGVMWGLGHTVTVFVVGVLLILLRLSISPRVGLSLEFIVAVMLVVLGVMNIAGWRSTVSRTSNVRPLVVGVVHGLAGSAAVTLMILPLIANPWTAAVYLALFGVGTVIGMASITALIAAPASYLAMRGPHLERGVRLVAGAASVAFGLYLGHQIGVVDGLFSATPSWSAH